MRYYSEDVEVELSPERLALEADLVGYHFRLKCACAKHENSGIVRDCKRWSENRWRWLAGISKRTIRRLQKAGLVRWLDDHLVVLGFNTYGVAALQQRRSEAANAAKRRWSRHAGRNAGGNAKDRSPTGDPPGDRSGPPANAQRSASSSSPAIEVVEAGGGRLPDGTWERIWAELPNRRSYWKPKARAAIEAVVVPDEVLEFLEFLNTGKRTSSWKRSPPTPLTIAEDFRSRRRPPAARKAAPTKTDEPSRDQIRASWSQVVDRSRPRKETGS
ncbi:MAG: hypothetical protein ACJ8GN_02010 [Longimicrobiaceae bacterium]